MIEIIEIDTARRHLYNDQLLNFEKKFTYPLGTDSFIIDHGNDYFRFFDRLGEPHFFIAQEHGNIVGVVGAVLRKVDIYNNGNPLLLWYLCDLKIDPAHRGLYLAQKFLYFGFKKYAPISKNIYAVSMNNRKSSHNRLARFAQRIPLLGLRECETLHFYLLDYHTLQQAKKILDHHLPQYKFISLSGIKDLIISSTSQPLPFLHLIKHQGEENIAGQAQDKKYMMCFPTSHPICTELEDVNIKPFASASVIANIANADWSFITSDEI